MPSVATTAAAIKTNFRISNPPWSDDSVGASSAGELERSASSRPLRSGLANEEAEAALLWRRTLLAVELGKIVDPTVQGDLG